MEDIRKLKFYEGAIKSLEVNYCGNMKTWVDESYVKNAYFYSCGRSFAAVDNDKVLLGKDETLNYIDHKRAESCHKNHLEMTFYCQFLDVDSLKLVTDKKVIDCLHEQIYLRKELEKEKEKNNKTFMSKLKKLKHKIRK